MKPTFGIGTHLASLNLFREPDGTVEITIAGATGAVAEFDQGKAATHATPVEYIEELTIEAACRIAVRRGLNGVEADAAIAIAEEAFRAGFQARDDLDHDWKIGREQEDAAWSDFVPSEATKEMTR